MVKPIERILRSGNFGVWDRPDVPGLDDLPPGLNPARSRTWGLDSHVFFPNFMVLVWATGWYLTYHYWPITHDRHIFEGTLYFAPAKTARDRMRQEMAAVTFKEFGLQDCNTLEATQTMLESRVVSEFPLGDQEILLRHLHHTAGEYVAAYQGGGVNDAQHAAPRVRRPRTLRRLGAAHRTRALRQAAGEQMDEMQAFYDAALPRLEDAALVSRAVAARRASRRRPAPPAALLFTDQRVVPSRSVAPAARARQRRIDPRGRDRARRLTLTIGTRRHDRDQRPAPSSNRAWRQRAVMRSLGAAHSRAEQQIDQFLDAAFALIDERGAADFTIREVSERCDQSIRRFYQYFDGKDELLLALFEVSVLEQTDDLRRTVDEESEPLARLRAFTIRLYEWCEPGGLERQAGHATSTDPSPTSRCSSRRCIPRVWKRRWSRSRTSCSSCSTTPSRRGWCGSPPCPERRCS